MPLRRTLAGPFVMSGWGSCPGMSLVWDPIVEESRSVDDGSEECVDHLFHILRFECHSLKLLAEVLC